MPPTNNHLMAFGALRDMYKRYMLNPTVARWLLARDAPSDFQVVRKEFAVQLSIHPDAPPDVRPRTAPHAPFPESDDLMFLDRNEDSFALGHIWGNVNTDDHPYSALAARSGKAGWDKVSTRKFASDLTVNDALECVEYVWFSNDRAMVILSRLPISAGKETVRTSEVLFFPPVKHSEIPPQRPDLVLLVHDRAVCASCDHDICSCENTLGVKRGSFDDFLAKSSCSGGPCTSPCTKMPWEERVRMMYHGDRRGLLTLFYYNTIGKDVQQITVSQSYVSTCSNQDVIAFRIQQKLTSLISKLPRSGSSHMRALGMDPGEASHGLTVNDQCGMPFTGEFSQSPVSFTTSPPSIAVLPKEGVWFEPHASKPAVTELKTRQNRCAEEKPDFYPKSVPEVEAKYRTPPEQCNSKAEASTGDTSARSLPSFRPGGDQYSRDLTLMQNSVCGPEKAGTECECSAESMPDPSLALILNSRRDRPVNPLAELTAFIEPGMEPTAGSATSGGGSNMHPIAGVGHAASDGVFREVERNRLESLGGSLRFGSQSPESSRLGAGTTLPSPLQPSPPLLLPGEPPLKRPRAGSAQRADAFSLTLEQGLSTSFDEQKGIAWNLSGVPDRPLSALGRNFAMTRSPSPMALLGNGHKTSPAQALAPSVPGLGIPRPLTQDCDFQNPFESSVAMAEAELAHKKQSGGGNGRAQISSQELIHDGSPLCGSRNTSEGATTNGSEVSSGNGVCCEICGIRFAKRSNKIRHIQTVHNRVKQFECDLCGQKFGLKADLGRHRYRIHESRAFCCDRCGKSFAEQAQLELHVRVTHELDSRPWECKQCEIRFGRKSSLTRHEQTVHERTRFTCRICSKTYSQKFDAIRHERKAHGLNVPSG